MLHSAYVRICGATQQPWPPHPHQKAHTEGGAAGLVTGGRPGRLLLSFVCLGPRGFHAGKASRQGQAPGAASRWARWGRGREGKEALPQPPCALCWQLCPLSPFLPLSAEPDLGHAWKVQTLKEIRRGGGQQAAGRAQGWACASSGGRGAAAKPVAHSLEMESGNHPGPHQPAVSSQASSGRLRAQDSTLDAAPRLGSKPSSEWIRSERLSSGPAGSPGTCPPDQGVPMPPKEVRARGQRFSMLTYHRRLVLSPASHGVVAATLLL